MPNFVVETSVTETSAFYRKVWYPKTRCSVNYVELSWSRLTGSDQKLHVRPIANSTVLPHPLPICRGMSLFVWDAWRKPTRGDEDTERV